MKTITIQKTSEADLPSIAQLAASIWREHYTPIIGSAQVEYMLDKYQSVSAMAEQITDGVFYYNVVLDDELVGYLSFYSNGEALFLSKIYVSSMHRGKGIGRQAMEFVIEQAKSMDLPKVQLTVNKYNTGSIEAYKRMGFKIVDEVVVDIGRGFVMDDYVMEIFLNE
ncbi:GNAT family N-acetyltransferase [Kangiella koreensis]|uniref:GCN5-related N-acetyltransferase n=1 Tax=Kangiella koreensis (strain DSM 16069 / JCM 12317 / KCTC 12182 / SW-125) TaxID=523791 RepID=C7RAZ6_KANKD|nr:GNAT family N-acetyltransferase [Kangiella koreensis]ACV26438.1 GCN5-related N-acetyltransferase [Kangiella koreensis DSM 16069]